VMAWGAHAITTAPATIFDANIFYPRSNALALSENLLGSMPLAAPFALAGQPVLGYNVVLLLSFFLFGVTTTLWVRYLTGNLAAGLVAGAAAAFAPSRMDHLPQIQILAAHWLPLSLLLVTRYADTGRARHLVGASCLVALQYWAGIQITLIFAPFVALYALAMIRARRRPLKMVQTATHVAVSAALFVALVLPVSLPYMSAAEEGMSRRLADTSQFSAQPKNYASPSEFNRMPHMRALRQYRGTESNHFAGITVWAVLGLAGASLLVSSANPPCHSCAPLLRLGRRGRLRRHRSRGVHARSRLADLRPGAGCAGHSPVCRPCSAAARGATRKRRQASTRFLVAVGARGNRLPGVARADGARLGSGTRDGSVSRPLRTDAVSEHTGSGALRTLTPYQSIRAVGRFGLATSLFLSAAVGVAVSTAAKGRPSLRWLAPVMLIFVVTEYWGAPLRTHDVTLADEEAYAALADLPGNGAVLHIPVMAPPVAAATTEYLLGSTRHWRPLLNGYSGFLPATVRRLSTMRPFSPAFFEFVQSQAPVDYLMLHGDKMGSGEFETRLTEAEASPYLERVGDYGHTRLYRWRPQVRSGVLLNQRYAWADADGKPITIEVRRTRGRPLDVELSWGSRIIDRASLGRKWQVLSVPPPTEADREANGSVRLGLHVVLGERWERPLGDTGTTLRADVLVDAQTNRIAVAVSDAWQVVEYGRRVIVCVVLSADGRRVVSARRFVSDDAGIAAAAGHVEGLERGAIVAIGIRAVDPEVGGPAASALRSMLESIGGRGRTDGHRLDRYVVLGVRGASPGTALERHSFSRAAVRAGPRTARLPTFEMR